VALKHTKKKYQCNSSLCTAKIKTKLAGLCWGTVFSANSTIFQFCRGGQFHWWMDLEQTHLPATIHRQTLLHNDVLNTYRHERDSNSQLQVVVNPTNYHTTTTTSKMKS
jgi:hypothetical protein